MLSRQRAPDTALNSNGVGLIRIRVLSSGSDASGVSTRSAANRGVSNTSRSAGGASSIRRGASGIGNTVQADRARAPASAKMPLRGLVIAVLLDSAAAPDGASRVLLKPAGKRVQVAEGAAQLP